MRRCMRLRRAAVAEKWARLGIRSERASRVHRVADAIEKRFDCFVQAEVADTGKPVSLASKAATFPARLRIFASLPT